MSISPAPNLASLPYLDELYSSYLADPGSVPEDVRGYFQALERGTVPVSSVGNAGNGAIVSPVEARLFELVEAYRTFGHRTAWLNPLASAPERGEELHPSTYGFTESDLDRVFPVSGLFGLERTTLRDLIDRLRRTYCRYIGVELMHIELPAIQRWVFERMEETENRLELSRSEQLRVLEKLSEAEVFEQFLHTKFLGEKRFSLEGGESLIPLLDLLIEDSSSRGVEEIVIGMAHRGRLNVLANILGKPASAIFRQFRDLDPEEMLGRGDVKYHHGYTTDKITNGGRKVHLALSFNPSHLEAIYPVIEGRVRAKQDRLRDAERRRALPIVIHGDAAFAGQGVVAETLNFSQVEGYRTGGTIHVIVNNQVGFTTTPEEGRSSIYATSLARMLDVPIFHVNGEDPESVVQVARLAVEFRHEFGRDVVIDLYCYRKHGHNEGDEPAFTQPLMYAEISRRPSVREAYMTRMLKNGKVTREEVEAITARQKDHLERELALSLTGGAKLESNALLAVWEGYFGGPESEAPRTATGVDKATLTELGRQLATVPEGFTPHPKARRAVLEPRLEMAEGKRPIDWGFAEALAFASIVSEGHRVRLAGQDVRRGTFSHRHAALFDVNTGAPYIPLANLRDAKATFEVHNSTLSEFGAMGFEYGYSLDSPDALVLWEAQFGDFVNGAQVILDQFLSSAEEKWGRLSGLTLLLPHGFEGGGPEHSSARLERFLEASAEDNWQVCNFTTPAQYFHALRRQVVRPWRKPLIVMSPKSLLRHKEAISTLEDLGGAFHPVLGDATAAEERVRTVLLCTGKVYFDLLHTRAEKAREDVAIVRVEQLYPFPADELNAELARYPKAERFIWVQEEPVNMGAWSFLRVRQQHRIHLNGKDLECVARPEGSSPATGSREAHKIEQRRVMEEAFAEAEANRAPRGRTRRKSSTAAASAQ